ncbi:related to cat eye syndrome critical region protein 5 precursor [Phialocephala subalpina]|uniref:Related to cat eye syndrome critical region protein 5 n=1 Tax=Phialocephala subalpina TaxID=576137 RepID=A0A1L7X0N9_9HELO|nr:related to cat eye syndrome critical region protein 5 precursor [Phialocephala subalpina]
MRLWTSTFRQSQLGSLGSNYIRCGLDSIECGVSRRLPSAKALHIQTLPKTLGHSRCRPQPARQSCSPPTRRLYCNPAAAVNGAPSFAFAFDIDGVLLRSSTPIPGAAKALTYLHNNNIPFILLTNGGGKYESARVAELTDKLGVPLSEDNFVQSHTPFKQLVGGYDGIEALKDKTIMVTGGDGDKCRKVAERYGFKNVIIPGDILMDNPTIWPFSQVFTDYYQKIHRPLPRPVDLADPAKSLKIDAIFVFNDPRDWALDSQIILDLLSSKQGILGTYSDKNGDTSLPNNGWQQDGQGGFQASLRGVWDVTTGGAKLERTVIGKPHAETYKYAENVLNTYRTHLLGAGTKGKPVGRLQRVFMVGDNPESDIRGANDYESAHDTKWTSCLVKTGVFREGTKPAYAPKVIVDDVLSAVKWALKSEGWKGDVP